MLTLRDIMTSDVVYTNADTPLSEVVAILGTEGITGVPVVASGRVVGVISAADILEFTETSPHAVDQVPEEEWGDVDRDMEQQLELEAPYAEWEDPGDLSIESPELEADVELYDTYTAGDIMTRKLTALPSSTDLVTAAKQMIRTGVHRVLVIDDGELVGIATSMDFLRAIAEGKIIAEQKA
jgi:CBS domain-containing protein